MAAVFSAVSGFGGTSYGASYWVQACCIQYNSEVTSVRC